MQLFTCEFLQCLDMILNELEMEPQVSKHAIGKYNI
jgi:hypothetical protein